MIETNKARIIETVTIIYKYFSILINVTCVYMRFNSCTQNKGQIKNEVEEH